MNRQAPTADKLGVVLCTRNAQEGTTYGTGAVVAQNGQQVVVLTNSHFVRDGEVGPLAGRRLNARNIEVSLWNMKWPARLITESPDADLALLAVDNVGYNLMPLKVAASPAPLNTRIDYVGYPGKSEQRMLSRTTALTNNQISRQPQKGESGSPVFYKGEVVGMINMRVMNESRGYFVPLSQVKRFLDGATARYAADYPALNALNANNNKPLKGGSDEKRYATADRVILSVAD